MNKWSSWPTGKAQHDLMSSLFISQSYIRYINQIQKANRLSK